MRYATVCAALALSVAACAAPAAVSNDSETSKQVLQRLDLLKGVGYDSPLHVESGRTIAELSEPPYEGHLWFA